MYAAKPVSWRGKGDLLQCAWASPPKGCWLVIDLWSGIGGLPLTLLSMCMHFYCLAAESDPAARQAVAASMPNIIHLEDTAQVRAQDFKEFLVRRRPRGIVIGGGSPCQGNSSLNKLRKGLDDSRSLQPVELVRIRDEFRALPEAAECEIISFLENVGSMPSGVCKQYSEWMECSPVNIDASTCGWVSRNRLYWLCSSKGGVHPGLSPPQDWTWDLSRDHPSLSFGGKKPIPARVSWQNGFAPLLDPTAVMKQAMKPMHTFTREFRHPVDRVSQASPQAAQRFFDDHRRFPPGAYEEHSLVWRHDQWRTLSPVERAQIMGIPVAAISHVSGPANLRHQVQNSWLGNSFHIPSILVLLCFLPQLMAAKIPPPWALDCESNLKARLTGTIWEPGRIECMPGLLTSDDVVNEVASMFGDLPIDPCIWSGLRARLSVCQLPLLQMYCAWCRLRGLEWEVLGPTPVGARDRSRLFAGLTGQRYPADSSRGLDHLLAPGLGKEVHLESSGRLPTPFAPQVWPEPDIGFVVEALFVWQAFLARWTQRLRHVFGTVATATAPLERALDQFRNVSSKKVASSKKPGLLAVLTALLRWPDRTQPVSLVTGYHIIGALEASGVFRSVTPGPPVELAGWLGEAAIGAVDEIVSQRPPRFAEDIYSVTCDEQQRNFCGPFVTRESLDRQFGRGQWRPLERFLIEQSDGKKRVIDNARRTGHNAHTELAETIWTVSVDCIASFASMVVQRFQLDQLQHGDHLDWLSLRIGTDDLPDAYRGLPVADQHLPFSIVAIYVPEVGWRFTPLFGLAYGLESAVVHFNRFPLVAIAAARRFCLSFCTSYFDDELSVEFLRDSNCSQRGLAAVLEALGAPPQAPKAFAPGYNRHYLGTSVHTGEFTTHCSIRFQPKTTTTEKVLRHLHAALNDNFLSRDAAGKLRGDLNWMFSNCAGQVGKFAGPVLTEIQTGPSQTLDIGMRGALTILSHIVAMAEPRDVYLTLPSTPIFRIYSDASFEDGALRLGWVCVPPQAQAFGGTCSVPDAVIHSWQDRKQRIFPGETLCGLIVPWFHYTHLRGHDLLWFIDNEAAASALIRGSCRPSDVHRIAQFSHVLLHGLGCRTWIEWIDSDSNCSDGLSRLGLADPWTLLQGWSLEEYAFTPELLPSTFLATFKSHIGMSDSG